MLTPRFELSQTEAYVTIVIYAPYANVADTEVCVDDDVFIFSSSPYYLRLHLPGAVQENESSQGKYDCDKGVFTFTVSKVTKGEHFPNLDFVTTLLMPVSKTSLRPEIEVIGNAESNTSDDEENEDYDWFLEQKYPAEDVDMPGLQKPKYGFCDLHSGVFSNLQWECLELLDLPEPDTTPASQRFALRTGRELEDFNEDHYMADMMESEEIESLLKFNILWNSDSSKTFTAAEMDVMKELPRREHLMDKDAQQTVYLGLVDILAAYCYNHRTTLGENTVESAWTINKLSATFSWFQCFSNLKDVTVAAVRRSLCYPLYRHWKLSMKIMEDVKSILRLGKKCVLKCLLEIYTLFNNSEPRYLLNKLYVIDYCIWIQKTREESLMSLAKSLDKIVIEKNDVCLDLVNIERCALLVQEEVNSSNIDEISDQLNKVSLQNCIENNDERDCLSDKYVSVDGDDSSSTCDDDDDDTTSDSSVDSDDVLTSDEENSHAGNS